MRTLAADTTPEAEAVLISKWREFPPAWKIQKLMGMRSFAKQLMLSGLRAQHPEANEDELAHRILMRFLGNENASQTLRAAASGVKLEGSMLNEAEVLKLIADRLDTLRIPYFVSGSTVSIVYGEPRLTNDADIVVRLFPVLVPRFVAAFEHDFVLSEDAVMDSLKRKYAFNIIHINTAFKIDFYPVSDDDDLEMDTFARRKRFDIGAGEMWFASPEDIVLAKLRWCQKGHGMSDQQWRDVLGVLKVQGDRIDRAYLNGQARRFGLAALLAQALEDAGPV